MKVTDDGKKKHMSVTAETWGDSFCTPGGHFHYDLTAYGENEEEARANFKTVLEKFIVMLQTTVAAEIDQPSINGAFRSIKHV